jgi:hypothetical protein
MIGGIAAALVLCAIPVLGLYVTKLAWRDKVSAYDRLGWLSIPFGENARYGLDAAIPVPLLFMGSGLAILGVLAAPEMMGLSFRWPNVVVLVLGPIVTVSVLGGLLLAVTLLLFLFPRFLAAPHLRDKRGWIPEWLHQVGRNRERRRVSKRRR